MVYGPVVVGVDDLEHSRYALEVAAREARLREAPLWLVHAYHWIPQVEFGAAAAGASDEAMRASASALLDEAVAHVRAADPKLAVRTVPVAGSAPQVLVEACPDASLLVVGGRGRGGFSGLMLGSVALRVVSHTHVPTMVVRGPAVLGTGHVLVGVDTDDPASGPELLEFAFAEAELRKVGVHAVHAWDDGRHLYLTLGGEFANRQFETVMADREKRFDALLSPQRDQHPGVPVSRQMFTDSVSKVIVESSRLADLVVLGGRVRDAGHEGLRVGALARTVLHHAHCPVVIVPEH